MHDLIEAIRAAVADGATAEAKQAGASACRTLLAALEATPGQAFAAAPAPPAPANPFAMLAGLDLDKALDLAIAKLRASLPADAAVDAPAKPGLRIPLIGVGDKAVKP